MSSAMQARVLEGRPWIIWEGPRPGTECLLFCLPYAGGGAHIFRAWQDLFPRSIQVCPLYLPGRGPRISEAAYTDCRELAQGIADGLAPLLDRPFALIGHSMGALASFEAARILRRKYGLSPVYMFVSGCAAPHVHREKQILHNLPAQDFREGLRQLGGIPPEVIQNDELMRIVEPMLRADFAVSETYEYKPGGLLSCPITAFHGSEDPYVSEEQAASWRELTNGEFHLHVLPGSHFFINSEYPQIIEAVAEYLSGRK